MADVGLTFMEPTMHNAAPCEEYQELHQATNHLAWSMEGQPRLQKAINHLGLLFCSNHEQTSSTWNVWAGQNCSPGNLKRRTPVATKWFSSRNRWNSKTMESDPMIGKVDNKRRISFHPLGEQT
jgi:hypothetical protein